MLTNTDGLLITLGDGGTIVYPTDTIRGVGCDAEDFEAVEKVYEVKQRPKEKSMIVLFSSEEMLAQYGVTLTEEQKKFLAQAAKPTTLVLSGVTGISPNAYAADGTLAVRIVVPVETNPGSVWVHEFITLYNKPIVSSSANMSGYVSPSSFSIISDDILERADAYLDPEIADTNGEPSQIVRIDTDGNLTILRP